MLLSKFTIVSDSALTMDYGWFSVPSKIRFYIGKLLQSLNIVYLTKCPLL